MTHAQENVRKPVVSGQFYPGSAEQLKKEIQTFLDNAKSKPDADVIALVSPHAGYPYSGQIAAEAYKTVQGRKFDSVIIIGFVHQTPIFGVFVDNADAYETPLGKVPLDKALADEIRNSNPALAAKPMGSLQEHSVEVQVPFLQIAVPNLKIVPIFIGIQQKQLASILSDAVVKAIGKKNVLVVATTDLSHYHPYDTAEKMDSLLVANFQSSDVEKLFRDDRQKKAEACGIGPLMTLLDIQQKMGWKKPELIRYANSGDVTGDKRAVVGYAAFKIRK